MVERLKKNGKGKMRKERQGGKQEDREERIEKGMEEGMEGSMEGDIGGRENEERKEG